MWGEQRDVNNVCGGNNKMEGKRKEKGQRKEGGKVGRRRPRLKGKKQSGLTHGPWKSMYKCMYMCT